MSTESLFMSSLVNYNYIALSDSRYHRPIWFLYKSVLLFLFLYGLCLCLHLEVSSRSFHHRLNSLEMDVRINLLQLESTNARLLFSFVERLLTSSFHSSSSRVLRLYTSRVQVREIFFFLWGSNRATVKIEEILFTNWIL